MSSEQQAGSRPLTLLRIVLCGGAVRRQRACQVWRCCRARAARRSVRRPGRAGLQPQHAIAEVLVSRLVLALTCRMPFPP